MTDRLSLANALADAKIERSAAERIATEIFEAIHDSVATKNDLQKVDDALRGDIAELRAELKADVAELRAGLKADVAELRAELKADVAELRAELKVDIARLRTETKADIATLRAEMALVEHRLLTRLGGLAVVLTGILFAALHYVPAAH